MRELNNMFEGTVNFYSCSKDFPERSYDEIPNDLINAIDNGNKSFFDNFKIGLPNTYEAFVNVCDRIQLCEKVVESFGEKLYVYYWCMKCSDLLALVNIPTVSCEHPYRKKNDIKFLRCIPEELHCFYKKMDGMSLSTKYTALDYDFPFEHTEWRELYQYCRDMKIQCSGSEKLITVC